MRPKNIRTSTKISNRPRHSQNAMHRPRRKLQQINRVFQHRLIIRREPTHGIRFRLIKMRVATPCALSLYFTRTDDTCANDITGFTRRRIRPQFCWRQARDFDMQVDALEQRA